MDTRNVSQAIADGPAIAGQIIDGACVARGFTPPASQANGYPPGYPPGGPGNPGPSYPLPLPVPCKPGPHNGGDWIGPGPHGHGPHNGGDWIGPGPHGGGGGGGGHGGPHGGGGNNECGPCASPISGSNCKPSACPPGQDCSFLPRGLLQAHGFCGYLRPHIQDCFLRKCSQVCDPCWLELLELSIASQSWAMVRNQIGRTFMRLGLSGYVAANQPVPDPDSSATTNFVANVPIAPGESVLLRQDKKYTLPWRPGCLKLTLGFSAGTMEDNMTHISAKVFVMRRGSFATTGALKTFAVEWNPDEFYDGTMFRCGDNCAEVQITGTLGCAVPIEHVGDENELLIQVTNDAAATNNITAIQATVSFAGLKKACCGDCIKGNSCSCK